jgi:D-xylose transport system substrate-binding protein
MRSPRRSRSSRWFVAGAVVSSLALGAGLALPPAVGAASARSTKKIPKISYKSFNLSFTVMKELKPVTKEGRGKIAAILPDTTSSTRYVEFDAPYLKKSMKLAGLKSSTIVVQNALGTTARQLADAETDITNGASVLLVDPLTAGTGAAIEAYANSHGVPVVDYDRLTLGGSRRYYVSFTNVQVGKLIGQGLVKCVTAWGVKTPHVMVMHGAVTDNNATLFAKGYYDVLTPLFKSGKYKNVVDTAGTWTTAVAKSEFEAAYTAHPTVNAAVIPNDETGAGIITYLKSKGIKPKTFPTTGQDATLTGLHNVLSGYQCGTVYKAIFLEAQAAVALGLYLRAGKTPPKSLVNGKVEDVQEHVKVTSVLLTPTWVTTSNMKSTIVKDHFVPSKTLCEGTYATACKAAGITA